MERNRREMLFEFIFIASLLICITAQILNIQEERLRFCSGTQKIDLVVTIKNEGKSGQVAVGGGDEKGYSCVKNDDTQFQVRMDCSHFSPEELSVKLVDDSLVVTGKHEERRDEHGYISREFTRRYLLPKDVQLDQIKSSLGADI